MIKAPKISKSKRSKSKNSKQDSLNKKLMILIRLRKLVKRLLNLKRKQNLRKRKQNLRKRKQNLRKRKQNLRKRPKPKKEEHDDLNFYQEAVEKIIKPKKDSSKYNKIKDMKKKDLQDKLVKLGLIKENSKAPIKVLRDIYFFYDMHKMVIRKS